MFVSSSCWCHTSPKIQIQILMLLTQFVFCVYASMDLERMVSLRLSVAAGGYHTSLSSPATTQYDTIRHNRPGDVTCQNIWHKSRCYATHSTLFKFQNFVNVISSLLQSHYDYARHIAYDLHYDYTRHFAYDYGMKGFIHNLCFVISLRSWSVLHQLINLVLRFYERQLH